MATRQSSGGPPWGYGREGTVRRKEPRAPPRGWRPRGRREALPGGRGARWLSSRRPLALLAAGDSAPSGSLIGPRRPVPGAISGPRAGAPYRGPQTPAVRPRAPQPDRGPPPAPPPPGVPGLLERPAPAPRREPSGTGCPARGCCVGRGRPSCARKLASAARKLLETQRRPARPVTLGGGGGCVLLQGLPGDGGGAGYFGLAPGQRHPQMGPGRQRQAPSRSDALDNKQATQPLAPLWLS